MRYAYVVFEKQRADVFTAPDGSVARVPPGEGEQAARAWFNKHVVPAAIAEADAAVTEWERGLAAFVATVDIQEGVRVRRDVTGSWRREWVVVDVIVAPDGTRTETEPGKARAKLRKQYRRQHGDCPARYDAAAGFEQWIGDKLARNERGWRAWWDEGEGLRRIDLHDPQWPTGTPTTAMVHVLNAKASDGWSVVSVQEDKGVYKGEDAGTESGATRVRYLLAQPSRR